MFRQTIECGFTLKLVGNMIITSNYYYYFYYYYYYYYYYYWLGYLQIPLRILFKVFAICKGSKISDDKKVSSANSFALLFKLFFSDY